MIRKLAFLFAFFAAIATHAQYYNTNFPATENPISQGSAWISGSAAGNNSTGGCPPAGGSNQCWGDVQTTPGLAFGTNTGPNCSGQVGQDCDDSTAVLSGAWTANQAACGTIFISGSLNRGHVNESELRLNTTISLHSITGYEFTYSMQNGGQYAGFVRWNGPLGQFSVFAGAPSPSVLTSGDTVCASHLGGTLKAWLIHAGTSTVITSVADTSIGGTVYTNGSPGVGFDNLNNAGDNGLYGWSSFTPANLAAFSANQADMLAVVNGSLHVAADGESALIPPGAVTWSAGISAPAGKGIQIFGSGTQNPSFLCNSTIQAGCGAGVPSTTITDNAGGSSLFVFNPTFGNSLTRLSTLNILPGTTNRPAIVLSGTCTASGCPNIRVDNTTTTEWDGLGIPGSAYMYAANVWGVIDHNSAVYNNVASGAAPTFVDTGQGHWLGVGSWGDNSWASSSTFGTNQQIDLENNILNGVVGTDTEIFDGVGTWGGGRYSCRFNYFPQINVNGACTGHGTDTTGRPRGTRQFEGLFNYLICANSNNGCNSAWPGRSGVIRSFGNTVIQTGGGFFKGLGGPDTQRQWRLVGVWGNGSGGGGYQCDGSAPWDTNDTNGGGGNTAHVYYTGTVGTVTDNGGWVITDSGAPGWTTNQWSPAGALYSFHDVTHTSFQLIGSNTSSVLQLDEDSEGGTSGTPVAGDTYQIQRAFVCLDQTGHSGGVLIRDSSDTNGIPVLNTTGMPGIVSQTIDPVYEADDSLQGANHTYAGGGNVILNRDIYSETVNQAAQSSPTSPFNGTSGTGHGTLANRPTTCTTAVGYWATDQGSWDTIPGGPQGVLYICTATNTWTLSYTPYTYPNPLITNSNTGGVPVVSFSPTSVAFGTVLVGSTSPSSTVKLTNTGTGPLTISNITITGTNPADFAQTNNCGGSVNAGGSCNIVATCTPLSAASFSASVSVTDNAAGSPQAVPLTCTGSSPSTGISFSPTSISFAGQTVGTSSSPTAITVTNTGGSTLTITGVAIVGGNTTSFTQTNNCGSVAPAGTCTINVTFSPKVAGALSSSVSVTDNAAGSPQSVPLTGTGNGVANIGFNPTTLAFGNQAVSSTSAALTTTISNPGTASLTLSSITLTGANAADYAISANTCGGSLAVGATCAVSVTFTPGSTGARTASLTFTDNAPASPQNVALTGTGTQAGASFSPPFLAFGSQAVGTTSTPLTTTLTNTGSATLNISSITLTGTNPGDFLISANTCGTTLAASGTCTVSVAFTPSVASTRGANLTFADSAPASPQNVALTGTGTGVAGISIAPSSIIFPSTKVGQESPTQQVTATNTGSAIINITSILVSGGNSGDFQKTNTTCGATLAVGTSCTVNMSFLPTASGARSSTLVFTDSAANSPQSVALSGTATQSGAVISPTSIAFPNTAVGVMSAGQNVTLTNNGTATLNISSILLGGTNPSYFSISANTCGATLAASANCVVSVTFTPQTAITATGTLSFTDDGPASPQMATLSGTGTTSALSFNPASLTFPNTALTVTSAPMTITVSNTGNGAVTISSIAVTGTNASNFAQTNNCGASLAGNSSCTVTVRFTPSANGSRTAADHLHGFSTRLSSNGVPSRARVYTGASSDPEYFVNRIRQSDCRLVIESAGSDSDEYRHSIAHSEHGDDGRLESR